MKKYSDIDGYIRNFPKETQIILKKIRATIRKTAPKAGEKISYGIPTLTMNDKPLVYFSAWKRHVSVYPAVTHLSESLEKKLATFRSGRGTYKFPLDKPIPYNLIRDFTKARLKANIAKFAKKGGKK